MATEINETEYLSITTADFYLNAGIVGFLNLLESIDAIEGQDYRIHEDELLVKKEFLLQRDLAQDYIDAFIQRFENDTAYTKILAAIDKLEHQLEQNDGSKEASKKIAETAKSIADGLSSASYKSGYGIIRGRGYDCKIPDLVTALKKEKDFTVLPLLRTELQVPIVKETLTFKNIIYTRINMFWENRAFLLRSDSNKDIKLLLKKEFTDLFCQYLTKSNGKRKDSCICCNAPMSAKEKSSIAFVKDVADDLGRKRSAFWNCNVDAYICPICNFLYALAPLGFMKIGPDMVFVNDNSSLRQLLQMNRQRDFKEENENRSWSVLYNEILGRELSQATKRTGNLQVAIRRKEQDRYDLNIVGKDVLSVAHKAKTSLDNLTKWSAIRLGDGYLNAYAEALDNLLHHRNQYLLIDRLFRMSIDTPNLIYCITSLLHLQEQQTHHRIQTKGGNEMGNNDTFFAAQAGAEFRKSLVKERLAENDKESADARLRGLTLQLLNDLRNRNQHSFLNRLYRIYAATSQKIPEIFGQMTQNDDTFLDLGYHFIRGLKGGYFEKKQEEEVNDEK